MGLPITVQYPLSKTQVLVCYRWYTGQMAAEGRVTNGWVSLRYSNVMNHISALLHWLILLHWNHLSVSPVQSYSLTLLHDPCHPHTCIFLLQFVVYYTYFSLHVYLLSDLRNPFF